MLFSRNFRNRFKVGQAVLVIIALVLNILPVTLFVQPAFAATGDFKNTDFAAAAPYTYDHNTGGGAYNDRTVGDYDDIVEQLEGAQFACSDVVTYLAQIEMEATTVDAVQTGRFEFLFLADSTGQSGAAHSEVLGVSINYGLVENGGGGGAGTFGIDTGISDDGGSTATLVSQTVTGPFFQAGSDLLATVDVNDLEPGEKVVLRIDTLLVCDPDSSPTGNLQGQLDAGTTFPSGETINTGQQTIPFLRVGDIAGAGEPLLKIEKSVTTAEDVCGLDDVEELSVVADEIVKYCYTVSNPGTADLFDLEVIDDNGTPSTSDDFAVSFSGLQDLDAEADLGDLASGETLYGEALVTLSVGGTVINTAEGIGNNGRSGGNLAELIASDTATVYVEAPPNSPPVAVDDSASTPEDTPVTIDASANDSDVDGNLDPASASVISGPSNGTLVNNEDGTFTYTPDENFSGTDSLTYKICDLEGLCDSATVTIDITSVNDGPVANDDSASTPEDTPVTINASANDSDVDGNLDPSSASVISGPSNGTLVNNGDGTFTYIPDENYFGDDSFSYEICDIDRACDTATVNITVNPVIDGPVADDDSARTPEDTPITINASSNDSDVDGNLDPTSAMVLEGPSNGTVTNNGDGTFTYTPNENFNGEDSFTYEICDTDDLCDTATVNIEVFPVNDAPLANDDTAATDEDVPVTIPVLDNDSDVDGDAVTGTEVSDPPNGTVTINPDGTVTYTPDPDYFGKDYFTYTVCDSDGLCDEATVTVTIGALNDAPVANDDSASTPEDTPVTIDASANDSDVDGNLDPTSAKVLSGPSNGTLVNNGDGTFTYIPEADFNVIDSFTYEICDLDGLCDSATVSIDITPVNDTPIANDDTYSTDEDTPLTVPAPGVLSNDSDVDGDALSVNLLTSPSNGSLTQNPDGSFTYKPDANFNGQDSYTYEACDPSGACDTATVTITVNPVNDPPVASDDAINLDEDTAAIIDAASNDFDVDGNLDPSSASVISGPFNGTLVNNGDGTFTYTPDENYFGDDSFSYEICDIDGACDTATVNITVNPVNDAPVANDDAYATQQDTALIVSAEEGLLPNDSDVDGDALNVDSYDAISQFGGSVSVNSDGSFEYTPAPGFAGYDTFTYTITDGNGYDTATVTIEVEARNNRSISVDWGDWTLDGSSLSGNFYITNQSDGYDVQIQDMEIVVQYRENGPGKKEWIDVAVSGYSFEPSPYFLLIDQQLVSFSGGELLESIPDGATIRVTARVQIYGRFNGKGKADGWFLDRLSK